ncbi:MAG TPA: zinc ribbon domain-containing protein [Candidatus Sulfotelmatobacter sp.]|nr:zinc ribbon domain-containing protein [Candidatus Sulfotelmatobacter sp.]
MPPSSTTSPATKVLLGCSKCGATLPDEALFCLKCGKPIALPLKEPVKIEEQVVEVAPRIKTGRIVLWVMLGLFLGATLWAGTSDSPFAQGIQELVGWKHDQTILDTPFSVTVHNFRYYKFDLPQGSMNVSIVGQFTSTSAEKKTASAKPATADGEDNDVEVYVLSENAFAVWQNGYATSSVYESGRVSQGTMQSDLPAGAGVYYLIFSNKFSHRASKNINATVLLRYKSWLPESARRMKERFWNWVGL